MASEILDMAGAPRVTISFDASLYSICHDECVDKKLRIWGKDDANRPKIDRRSRVHSYVRRASNRTTGREGRGLSAEYMEMASKCEVPTIFGKRIIQWRQSIGDGSIPEHTLHPCRSPWREDGEMQGVECHQRSVAPGSIPRSS